MTSPIPTPETFVSSFRLTAQKSNGKSVILVDEKYESDSYGAAFDAVIRGGMETGEMLEENPDAVFKVWGKKSGMLKIITTYPPRSPGSQAAILESKLAFNYLPGREVWSGDLSHETLQLVSRQILSEVKSVVDKVNISGIRHVTPVSFYSNGHSPILIPEDISSTFFTGSTLDCFLAVIVPLLKDEPEEGFTAEQKLIRRALVEGDEHVSGELLRLAKNGELTETLFLIGMGLSEVKDRIDMQTMTRLLVNGKYSGRLLSAAVEFAEFDYETTSKALEHPNLSASTCYLLTDEVFSDIPVRAAFRFFAHPQTPDRMIIRNLLDDEFSTLALQAYVQRHPEYGDYPLEWVKEILTR